MPGLLARVKQLSPARILARLKTVDGDGSGLDADLLDGQEASAFASATHASTHQAGGSDAIKLDDLAAPDDNTDLDATTSAHGLMPKADKAKLDHITVTQPVDLDAIESRVNDLDAAVVLQGEWDASTGFFPGGGSAQAGHSWIVSTAGTVDGVEFEVDDRIIAITDDASTSTFDGNWHKADYSDVFQTDAEIEAAYNNQVAAASQAEMEAGTETAIRRMSPQRVAQAIAAQAGSGGSELQGFKNVVINGDFSVWQRGTSFDAETGDYTADRWLVRRGDSGSAVTITQDSDVPSGMIGSSLKWDVTAAKTMGASDFYALSHRIEGYDLRRFAFGTSGAQQLTVSFWVKSPKTGMHSIALQNSSGTRSYVATYSVSVADTWEEKNVTLAGDTSGTWQSTTSTGCELSFTIGVGSNFQASSDNAWESANNMGSASAPNIMDSTSNTFFLYGVQMELGAVATAFEHRPIGVELALCQRYYAKSYQVSTDPGANTNDGAFEMYVGSSNKVEKGTVFFPVHMRSSPSVTEYDVNGSAGFVTTPAGAVTGLVDFISEKSCRVGVQSSADAGDWLRCHYTADAEL